METQTHRPRLSEVDEHGVSPERQEESPEDDARLQPETERPRSETETGEKVKHANQYSGPEYLKEEHGPNCLLCFLESNPEASKALAEKRKTLREQSNHYRPGRPRQEDRREGQI